MMTWKTALALAACCCLAGLTALAADAEPTGPLVLTDSAGKEYKLKGYRFAVGTRHLSWLAPPDKKEPEKKEPLPKGKEKPKPPAGPEALEMREEHSTGFQEGILTLVPLTHIRSIEFDPDKQTVAVSVAGAKDDAVLTGTTKYRGINKVTIEADVDKGDLGVAEVRFLGGVPKANLKKLAFPSSKAPAAVDGRGAVITDSDKPKKGTHKVVDLQPLYRLADGSERLLPTLMFKKTLKLDVSKIAKIHLGEDKPKDPDAPEWTITTKDGEETALTLLKTIDLDGKPAVLEGLIGRIPGGYRLFPIHTISDIQFDAKTE